MPFRKMNGLGNDFVVLDLRAHPLALTEELVRRIADRENGVGCDQFITIEPAREGGDAFMGIRNNDGGTVEACGNAARCIGQILLDETDKDSVTIETLGGDTVAMHGPDGTITVDMGEPRLNWDEIPLSEEFRDTRAIELEVGPLGDPIMHSPAVVNVGNPHAIFFVDDVDAIDLGRIGPMLEHHPLFPERVNISVAQVLSPTHIRIRTWERGAGLTKACGTAACASAVAAIRRRKTERIMTVSLPGGDLTLEWREADNHIYMTGPATLDYESELDPALLSGGAA
ncbi:diaminopimelate epimerase [Parvibaculum indicum]|uniref:diaminopimelate epimerase n=1 Tax=Parvibaculum indicum TaxID=562969 RepID=UPI00196653F2|nr:diaminopimelate epimerase [Parvibaculum indicum]NIJ41281.1 diaminopimelate epimerase [Parvibaculum indicum]